MENVVIGQVKELKPGKYVIIDGMPCKVVDVQKSKPGKHGSAKARVTAIGIFTGQKKILMKPVTTNCEIPIVRKKKAQVIADMGAKVQLMDMETYETFEVDKPEDFPVEAGKEVPYQVAMGIKRIVQK